MGELAILNVGEGDTKLSFDPGKPAEVERAKSVVMDMIRRGFVLLIEIGEQDGEPIYRRAKGFDPATCEYIIAGSPGEGELANDEKPAATPRRGRQATTRKRPPDKRIPAASVKATAVSRTAGG
jgi:hypothetical protein